jgi:peptide/nickel transport system substrate-binding protein
MAKHYHLSDDGKTLNFVIYDGLTWHDGSPLTVEDIRWSVEFSVKTPVLGSVFRTTFESLKGVKAYKDGSASHIAGITTKGKTSITFEFEKLDPNTLMTFSQWPPLPKKHLQDADPNKFQQHPYFQRPIGSGPYKIKKVEMNDYVVMVPFEDFHGGRAKIDEIVCYPSMDNDPDVIKNARAGKLDVGFTKNVADVMSLQKMDHMRVIPVDIPYTRILWINQYPMK